MAFLPSLIFILSNTRIMLLELTQDEMIDKWLLREGFEPLRSDCIVSRSHGVNLREIARRECALWYEKLLREADAELLPVENLADDSSIMLSATLSGSIMFTLPEKVVRPVGVKLSSWLRAADIVPPDSATARLQRNPYLRGGMENPVAIYHPLERKVELFSPAYNNHDILDSLLCVVRKYDEDGEPLYVFDNTLFE